jgi:hypothetical protein
MTFFNIPVDTNDPRFAGRQASGKVLFGFCSRYALYAVHTRGDAVQWLVADAESMDAETGLPGIIRQAATPEEAVAGLADDAWPFEGAKLKAKRARRAASSRARVDSSGS